MSTYVIDHQCGHQITYNLVGRAKDREWRATRLRERACDACLREHHINASRAAGQNARDELGDAAVELPPLTGSEKQIAWAADLRAQVIVELRQARAGTVRLGVESAVERIFLGLDAPDYLRVQVFDVILAAATAQTEARWWIDRRRIGILGHLRAAAWISVTGSEISRFADVVGYVLRDHLERHEAAHHTVRRLGLLSVELMLSEWVTAADHSAFVRPSKSDDALRWWAGVYDVARPAMIAGDLAERLAPPMEDL